MKSQARAVAPIVQIYAEKSHFQQPNIWASIPVTVRLFLVYVGVTLLTRAVTYGNPVIHIDEQFYLAIGDRILHGEWPYIDNFDRKPLGLFLLYAFFSSLGSDGVLMYQLGATVFVAATSVVIFKLARSHATACGAFVAGLVYPLYLPIFNCFGGQAPVFYNFFVAFAALVALRQFAARTDEGLLARGSIAMLLIGLAMQIKYNPIFEGTVIGLVLLYLGYRHGWAKARLLATALIWIACALLPTAAAFGGYAIAGHGREFIDANFLSIGDRQEPFLGALWRLTKQIAVLLPFWIGIFWSVRSWLQLPDGIGFTPERRFLAAWATAAVGGYLLFGTWYDHYVGPLLVPLPVLAAQAFEPTERRKNILRLVALIWGIVASVAVMQFHMRRHGTREQIVQMSALIDQARQGGCIYLNEGHPIIYYYTKACLVTRYVFPNHVVSLVEENTVDQMAETARIIARRPAAIVMAKKSNTPRVNERVIALVKSELAANYHLFAATSTGTVDWLIYQRNDVGAASK